MLLYRCIIEPYDIQSIFIQDCAWYIKNDFVNLYLSLREMHYMALHWIASLQENQIDKKYYWMVLLLQIWGLASCYYIKGQETLNLILTIYFSVLTGVQDVSIYYSLLCNHKRLIWTPPPLQTHTNTHTQSRGTDWGALCGCGRLFIWFYTPLWKI